MTTRKSTPKAAPKPSVPEDFPLWWHPSGRWCKKIKGKAHYFGRDPQEALDEWLRVKDALLAGKVPPPKAEGVELRDVTNAFLTAQQRKLDTRELSPHSFAGYYRTCKRMVKLLGASCPVVTLGPDDFSRLRSEFAKTHGPAALAGDVQQVKTIFKWAWESDLLPRPARFGPHFRRPSKKAVHESRQGKTRMFEAVELQRVIGTARQPLKTMIILGLNCGFGPTDIGRLPLSALDLEGGWIDFPRVKTAIPRRIPLWPETVALLREAVRQRPEPREPRWTDRVFLNSRGIPWEGDRRQNLISRRFRELLNRLGLFKPGRSFYSCRHIVETVGGDLADQVAVDVLMGHRRGDMAEHHRHKVSDDRLQAVTEHIREWLFPPDEEEAPATVPFRARHG